jgi:hippurate hydrolase
MRSLLFLVSALLLASANIASSAEPGNWAKEHAEELVKLYKHFHAHPEVSLMETQTAARLAAELKMAGAEVTTGVGGTGVVGILKNGPGKTLMVRTDLDALPVTEQTGLAYASKVKLKTDQGEVGVMHACGHDVHITCLIGVAQYCATHKDAWQGTLILLGQPAEERGMGAKRMLDDKLFERFPKPDFALALHCDSGLATGKVGMRVGYTLANVDSVDITVRGKGGHGAYPHTTVDPIVQAAQLILALQTIVSREVKPTEPAVVTVGAIHGGSKHNIISDSCHLQLTVRSYSDEVRQQVLQAIERKAKGIALSCNAPEPDVKFSEGTPSLYNDDKLTGRITELFQRRLGKEQVVNSEQSMGGEDFSQYGRAGVPICMFRLGAVDGKRLARFKELGQDPPSLHSPLFYPDAEDAIVTGVNAMCLAVQDLLKDGK